MFFLWRIVEERKKLEPEGNTYKRRLIGCRLGLLVDRQPLWKLVTDLLGWFIHEVLGQQLPHHTVYHLPSQCCMEKYLTNDEQSQREMQCALPRCNPPFLPGIQTEPSFPPSYSLRPVLSCQLQNPPCRVAHC